MRRITLVFSLALALFFLLGNFPAFAQSRDGQGSDYFFPQVADGSYSGGAYSTSFTFSNIFSGTDNLITLSFFKQSGAAWSVKLASQDRTDLGGTFSKKTFTLKRGESLEIYTQGSDPLAVGWAMVTADFPVVVSAVFQVFEGGRVTSEGGVLAAPLATEFSFYSTVTRDEPTIGTNIDTGFAVINPSLQSSSRITATLFSQNGAQAAQNFIDLNPMSQKAIFVSQVFSGFSFGSQFHGRIRLSSNVNIAAVAIRQTSGKSNTISTVAVQPESNLGYGIMYDREPNGDYNTSQPILSLPMEIIGTMANPLDPQFTGDIDMYSIRLEAGQTLYVMMIHEYLNCSLGADIILRNSQGIQVANAGGNNLRSPLIYAAQTSGAYYIDLGCLKNNGVTTCGRGAFYRMHVMVK